MLSPVTLYTTVALMALVATACTALCVVWSVPAWRHRLSPAAADRSEPRGRALSGRAALIGSGLVSVGIAACALLAWYGVYCTLSGV